MSYFKVKMHKIRSPLGLCPRPRWGAYSAPPYPIAVFKEPTFKGREGKKEGNGREREGKGKRMGNEGDGRGHTHPTFFGTALGRTGGRMLLWDATCSVIVDCC